MRRSSKKSSSSAAADNALSPREEQVNEKQNRKRKGVSTNLTSRKAQRGPTKVVSKEIEWIDQLFYTYTDSSSGMIECIFLLFHNMDKILERYERYSYSEKVLISAESETQDAAFFGICCVKKTSRRDFNVLGFQRIKYYMEDGNAEHAPCFKECT